MVIKPEYNKEKIATQKKYFVQNVYGDAGLDFIERLQIKMQLINKNNSMINQELANITNEFEQDNDKFICFRYSDLTRPAQVRLIKALKQKSSIQRIKSDKIKCQDMDKALTIVDPPIFENYYNRFSQGQLPRWRELQLSRIIYHLNRKGKPNKESIAAIIYNAGKIIREDLRRKYLPTRSEIVEDLQRERETERLRNNPIEDLDRRLDEMLTEPISQEPTPGFLNYMEGHSFTTRDETTGTLTEESLRNAVEAMRNNGMSEGSPLTATEISAQNTRNFWYRAEESPEILRRTPPLQTPNIGDLEF